MSCIKCDREVYGNGDTCIFHCEKEGWSNNKIIFFQKKLNELKFKKDEKQEEIYNQFIFPKLELEALTENRTYYNNIVFNKHINLKDKKISKQLIFINCTFEKPLNFKNCTFGKEVKFKDTVIKDYINFINCTFEFKTYFFNLKEIKILNFKNVIFNELKINDNESSMICYFNNSKFYDSFEIFGTV